MRLPPLAFTLASGQGYWLFVQLALSYAFTSFAALGS